MARVGTVEKDVELVGAEVYLLWGYLLFEAKYDGRCGGKVLIQASVMDDLAIGVI